MEENKFEQQKKTIRILTGIIILLSIVCLILLIQLLNVKTDIQVITAQADSTAVEREKLRLELDSLKAEHERIKREYGSLSEKLVEKDSIIQANIKEIESLLNAKVELNRIRRKMDLLRSITQRYVKQIDSLFTVNNQLREENIEIKNKYSTERQKNIELTKIKEELTTKVTKAAVLQAVRVSGYGIKLKKKGEKEEIVNKAKKADALKILFTIVENSLIEPGNKDLFVRIAGPDDRILTDGKDDASHTFEYNGSYIQYSFKKTINYQGKTMEITHNWQQSADFKPGVYTVDVFCDGKVIGTGTFSLE